MSRSIPHRLLACLMICILLFTAFLRPIIVSAFEPITMSVVGVGAVALVGSILIAVGLAPDGLSDFLDLCNEIIASISDEFKFVDEAGTVFLETISVGTSHYARHELVQEILDLLFAETVTADVVTVPVVDRVFSDFVSIDTYSSCVDALKALQISNSSLYPYYSRIKTFSTCYQLTLSDWAYGDEVFIWTSDSIDVQSSTFDGVASILVTATGPYVLGYYHSTLGKYVFESSKQTISSTAFHEVASSASVASATVAYLSDVYTIGNLAEDLTDEEYETWGQLRVVETGGGQDPDDGSDDLHYYWPVTVVDPEEFPDLSQNEAQQPTPTTPEVQFDTLESVIVVPSPVEVSDPSTGSDSGTDQDSNTNTGTNTGSNSNPDTDGDSDTDTDADSGSDSSGGGFTGSFGSSGSPSAGNFQIDLRNFFPFCIPFDLYKMLNCLVADPVAPCFTFAVPFLGEVYTVTVDLSAWNSVAQTVRIVQVSIFCVGLVVATRKFIKW